MRDLGLKGWMLAGLLIASGIVLRWLGPPRLIQPFCELVAALSDAMMIAGLLACIVDPFLKKELLREAARGIFVHMIGFDHKPEIKARLQEIAFGTVFYREGYTVDMEIIPEDVLRTTLKMTIRYSIINASQVDQKYQHQMHFNEYEHGSVTAMSIMSTDDPSVNTADFAETPDKRKTGRVKTFSVKEAELKPEVKYECFTACSATLPRDHFFVLHMSHPTI